MDEYAKILQDVVVTIDELTGMGNCVTVTMPSTMDSIVVSYINPNQVTDPQAPPHVDKYVGPLQMDPIIRWFTNTVQQDLVQAVRHALVRAVCKQSDLVTERQRVDLSGELAKEFGQEWFRNYKAMHKLYARVLEICASTAKCPDCGAHETFVGNLANLTCANCGLWWDANNPINARWVVKL